MTATTNGLALGQFIPLHYHFQMLLDDARMRGFRAALAHHVPLDGRVLDLGGGTGVLSYFAAQRAARVWCVERNPELVHAAKRALARNGVAARVEVVTADARTYLPPEPVDVVVCEMLHAGLLREKQVEVIASFKKRYAQRFGGRLPIFVPEATILAVQPVHYRFAFAEYEVAIPLFFDPMGPQDGVTELGDPLVYAALDYREALPTRFDWQGTCSFTRDATFNALRFVTKNVLAVTLGDDPTIDWHNQYLVIPTPEALPVHAGDEAVIRFAYEAGAEIDALVDSVAVTRAGQIRQAFAA